MIIKNDTASIVYQYKATGRYKVKLKAIDLGSCIGVDSTYTFVDVFKVESKVQDNDVICEGANYILKASGGVLYDWETGDKLFSSAEASPHIEPKDTTVYYVTITENSGCVHKDTVQIGVIPSLDLDFKLNFNSDCFSRPSISVRGRTQHTQSSDIIFFDFGDGQTSDLNDITHEYVADGLYHVKMIGSREFCGYEKDVDIPLYTIKVPNVITPGGSPGVNDKFVVQFGETPGITPEDYGIKVSVKIYNRWGTPVFESKDYKYDWGGEGLAPGVYYYDLTIEGITTCKEWVQIIK